MKQLTFQSTRRACCVGYITLAVVNNLMPLLFSIFQEQFGISFEKLGRLILVNFLIQLLVDVATVRVVDRFGYRKLMVLAGACSTAGLTLLAVLPNLLARPYPALVLCVALYSVGGGLIEVLVSPLIDSLPSDDKAGSMSLLHSFYCWGQMAVVLLTTLALRVIGRQYWMWIAAAWAVVPLYTLLRFLRVPLVPTQPEEGHTPIRSLFRSKTFWMVLLITLCAGAAELVMSQWSSLFAEEGLGVSKVVGDLLGPCLFAVLMGTGRTIYGVLGSRIPIEKGLMYSSLLCVACYATAVLSPNAFVSLLACAVCGLSVSLMWPGALSFASSLFPRGGAAMFGVFALFGDIGCVVGPWVSGIVSDLALQSHPGAPDAYGLKAGLSFGALFPVLLLVMTGTYLLVRSRRAARERALTR